MPVGQIQFFSVNKLALTDLCARPCPFSAITRITRGFQATQFHELLGVCCTLHIENRVNNNILVYKGLTSESDVCINYLNF